MNARILTTEWRLERIERLLDTATARLDGRGYMALGMGLGLGEVT